MLTLYTLGTWKLNLQKSTYTPGPMPVRSLTVNREVFQGGVKVTITGELANGMAIHATYMAKYDGKHVPVTGNLPYDSISIDHMNPHTLWEERKKAGGPYHAMGRTVISDGGETMTTTSKGTNSDGKEFTSAFCFDKL
jgi:hypothetical protein